MNYYALNLNLWIFVDILTMIFGRRWIFGAQIVKWHHFLMFCSVKWRVLETLISFWFLKFSITDMRLVWHRRHKSKRFLFYPWDKNKMWCAILFCKWCHLVQFIKVHIRGFSIYKFTLSWIFNFQTSEIKFKNKKARFSVFAELSETTTCV